MFQTMFSLFQNHLYSQCWRYSLSLNIPQRYRLLLGGSSLPRDKIISNHTVNSGIVPIECYELCQKESKCVGFNYIEKINVMNCQLTNITGKRIHTTMTGEGEWILMVDMNSGITDINRLDWALQ